MKEYDLSLLFFDVGALADYSDIEKIIEEPPVKKKWQGAECVEVFCGEPSAADELSSLVEDFLRMSLVSSLLKLQRRKALRIGVFFDTASCNFSLNPKIILQLEKLDLEVIFSCYPSAESKEG